MNTKTILTLFSTLIVLLLLVSCQPDTNPEDIAASQPEEESQVSSPLTGAMIVDVPAAKETSQSAIQDDLLAKSKQITNYKTFYQSMYRNANGLFIQQESYSLDVKGSKIKVTYPEHKKTDGGNNYDTLYLDNQAKTAYAVCEATGVLCAEEKNTAFKLSYDAEKDVTLPITLLSGIDSADFNILLLKEQTYDNRKVLLVEFVNVNADPEGLYFDVFYGLPLQQIIYGSDHGEKVVNLQRTFSRLSVGGVQDSDVSFSKDYTIK